MRYSRWVCFGRLVFSSVAIMIPLSTSLLGQDRATQRVLTQSRFREMMDGYKSVGHLKGIEAPERLSEDDLRELWMRGVPKSTVLHEIWRNPDTPREDVKKYVSGFFDELGQSDAVDFRIFINEWNAITPFVIFHDFGYDSFSDEERRYQDWVCEEFARAQVIDGCQDPRLLERIVWYSAWLRCFSDAPDASLVYGLSGQFFEIRYEWAEKFEQGNSVPREGNEYWQCSRAFLWFACMTNRQDLFVGADPNDLKPQFDRWCKWFDANATARKFRASEISPTWVVTNYRQPHPTDAEFELGDFVPLAVLPRTPFGRWLDLPPPPSKRFVRAISLDGRSSNERYVQFGRTVPDQADPH